MEKALDYSRMFFTLRKNGFILDWITERFFDSSLLKIKVLYSGKKVLLEFSNVLQTKIKVLFTERFFGKPKMVLLLRNSLFIFKSVQHVSAHFHLFNCCRRIC